MSMYKTDFWACFDILGNSIPWLLKCEKFMEMCHKITIANTRTQHVGGFSLCAKIDFVWHFYGNNSNEYNNVTVYECLAMFTFTNFAHNWIFQSGMWYSRRSSDGVTPPDTYFIYLYYTILYFIFYSYRNWWQCDGWIYLPGTHSRKWIFMRRNFCMPMCRASHDGTRPNTRCPMFLECFRKKHSMSLIIIIAKSLVKNWIYWTCSQ